MTPPSFRDDWPDMVVDDQDDYRENQSVNLFGALPNRQAFVHLIIWNIVLVQEAMEGFCDTSI